jgi:hypothetical protein
MRNLLAWIYSFHVITLWATVFARISVWLVRLHAPGLFKKSTTQMNP